MNGAPDSSYKLDSASPLEIALDRAMDRYWSAEETQRIAQRSQRRAAATALAVTSAETALATLPARLKWRGIEVSEEFQHYAARVARGEQLAPFRGQVLARQCPEFPWGPAPRAPLRRAGPGRKAKLGAVLLSAGTALVAAIGVGSGTATSVEDELDAIQPDHDQHTALRPAPYVLDPDLDDTLQTAAARHGERTIAANTGEAKAPPSRRRRPAPPRRASATSARANAGAGSASFPTTHVPPNASSVVTSADTGAAPFASEDPFGLDELIAASKTNGAPSPDANTPPRATPQPASVTGSANGTVTGTASGTATAQRIPEAASRVGEPSDWDPTGKMSILFSDDLPF